MAQNCWSWAVEHQDRGQQPLSTRESIQVDFFYYYYYFNSIGLLILAMPSPLAHGKVHLEEAEIPLVQSSQRGGWFYLT